MKVLSIFVFCTLARASDYTGIGTLYIPELIDDNFYGDLNIEDNQLVIKEWSGFFSYRSGSLQIKSSGQYLTFNDAGKLDLSDLPDENFSVTPQKGKSTVKKLSYKGEDTFALCSDLMVRYNTTCGCGRSVSITYTDLIN
ncbi:hypothetical protein JCM33374_g1437 [Metschnikowia sp. JCM 33374]|nr:hypothetical protein JCM33374_g1437 [Metschnikowia sp. JCM 33374]